MIAVALVVYLIGLFVAFGLRTWDHFRRTGSTGFNGVSGHAGSLSWWGGVLFIVALAFGLASPVLAILHVVPGLTLTSSASTVLAWIGLVLLVLGIALTVVAQAGMGTNWRIGVNPADRTDLVTSGLFGHTRNPIFTGMIIAQVGLTLAVPSIPSILALSFLIAAIHIQVRTIEEPHLARVHGDDWLTYMSRTGRYFPRRMSQD